MSISIIDNDKDEITASLDGKEVYVWSYKDRAERRIKMLLAHAFAEGWFQAERRRSGELEYAYRVIQNGFDYGTFDFSVLSQRAAYFLSGQPLPKHLTEEPTR